MLMPRQNLQCPRTQDGVPLFRDIFGVVDYCRSAGCRVRKGYGQTIDGSEDQLGRTAELQCTTDLSGKAQ